jgi:hypothetical protein
MQTIYKLFVFILILSINSSDQALPPSDEYEYVEYEVDSETTEIPEMTEIDVIYNGTNGTDFSNSNLLNETYNLHLKKDAKFAWINFTEMITNISATISEVLYNKTLLVKDLSEQVEKAFDSYQNDTEKLYKSLNFTYYDAKSYRTFCDTKAAYEEQKKNKNKAPQKEGIAKTETR